MDQQPSLAPVPFDRTPSSNSAGGVGQTARKRRGILGWCWLLIKWPLMMVLVPVMLYLAIAIIGAWVPANADFTSATDDAVEIFIASSDIHADVILPIANDQKDWRTQFPASSFGTTPTQFSHVRIGWGERKFYLETPTWNDLKVSTVVSALLLPTETVMHVEMVQFRPVISPTLMSIKVNPQQYGRLVKFVEDSFDRPNAQIAPVPIEGYRYGLNDRFYPAVGSYHLFQNCNSWTGDAMRQAGIKVGQITLLPKSMLWHLTR